MRKSKQIDATATAAGVQPTPWPQLAQQWQAAGMEWAQWWSRATNARSDVPPTGDVIHALAASTVATPWIAPDELAEVTSRYQQKLQALWARTLSGDVPTSTG